MDEENVSLQGEAPAQPQIPQEPVAADTQETSSPSPDTETPAESSKKELSPAQQIAQKRIDQLTWKAHEAERRLNAELIRRQETEDRARQYEAQLAEVMRRATMPTMEAVGHDPEAYARAVQQHAEQWLQQQQAEQMRRQQNETQMQRQMHFQQTLDARVAEGRQKFADFEEVVNNPQLPTLSTVNPAVLAAILEHDQMPEITYFLGKNAGEAHRIAGLPPARAILEVGKIAARLASSPPQPSRAPPPPDQVTGHSATVRKDPAQMSYDEFVAYRRKQIAARR